MNHPTTPALIAGLALALTTGCTGCGSTWFATGSEKNPAVSPEDFVGEPRPTVARDQPTTLVATDVADEQADQDNTPGTPRSDEAVSINAMVGHINGEAVYADQIFDINVIAQLESFGRRFERGEFLKQAALVIQDRLRGVIINKLILGEAERNLTDNQRRGIAYRVQSEREELLRFYGQGALSVAKARFREEKGIELDAHLTTFREELIIRSYISSKVLPKIVVNERDIERWYEDHKSEYDKPDRRAFRIIKVDSAKRADEVVNRMKRGESFKDVASDGAVNLYNPGGAGEFNGGELLAGDHVYGIKPVNDALIELEEGKHAGPIVAGSHHYFVQVMRFEPGVTISLSEAQLKIEQQLRAMQFEKHALRFRLDLLQRGSYTDPTEMGAKLLEIAYARYDQ